MKLSVILPCLKRDALVERAMHSVGAAPNGVELEWVVVEGVHPIARARNVGLSRATGDYIAWVDGDDEVTNDWLPEIVLALRDRPDIVLFDCEMVGWRTQKELVYGGDGGWLNTDDVLRDIYRDQRLCGHVWRMVYRRGIWQGLSCAEWTLSLEDFLIMPSVVSRAARILYLPKKLYRYYHNDSSIIHSYDVKRTVFDLKVAIERYRICDRRFKGAALFGSAKIVCLALRMFTPETEERLPSDAQSIVKEGRRFLRQNLITLWRELAFLGSHRQRLGWELRFVVSAFGLRRYLRKWK